MRARKKKNTQLRLEKVAPWMISWVEPTEHLQIEIGCGKGTFLSAMAADFPNCQFVGVEKVADVIVMAAEKAQAAGLNNLKFLLGDAWDLTGSKERRYMGKEKGQPIFETVDHPALCSQAAAEVLYLNFSDPWPRNRDAERRLTHRFFLHRYRTILRPEGWLELKTDNVSLFNFSLEELAADGWELWDLTRDLHSSIIANPYHTEYEERFSRQGIPICHVKARPKGERK